MPIEKKIKEFFKSLWHKGLRRFHAKSPAHAKAIIIVFLMINSQDDKNPLNGWVGPIGGDGVHAPPERGRAQLPSLGRRVEGVGAPP